MNVMGKTVDVIIPVYKPGPEFTELLKRLQNQDYPVHQIIIMHTVVPGYPLPLEAAGADVLVEELTPAEFDHGGTRNRGVMLSSADYVMFLTQDALPKDEHLVGSLVRAFSEDKVASAYARQLPNENCRDIEKFTRAFNYPDRSYVKTEKDIAAMGIKTFFCSDVASMYDREVFLKLGGFTDHTIFNEDMIYAHTVITHGYGVSYTADAEVIHSHNYSGKEQFRRNFDLAVSQADHPEVFSTVSSEKEGLSLVKKTVKHLWKIKKIYLVFQLVYMSGMKYLGYFLGKRYRKLPEKLVLKFTMNKNYWRKENGTD